MHQVLKHSKSSPFKDILSYAVGTKDSYTGIIIHKMSSAQNKCYTNISVIDYSSTIISIVNICVIGCKLYHLSVSNNKNTLCNDLHNVNTTQRWDYRFYE